MSYYDVIDFIDPTIIVLHSHEIFEHYLLSEKYTPYYVVSQRIAQQYVDRGFVSPRVQPAVLQNIDEILEKSNEPVDLKSIRNQFGIMNPEKITIGMCGQISERKNTRLFIDVAKAFPQYNFLWVGGDTNINVDMVSNPNIYHIPFTINPYKYYKQIYDYFILFSKFDPCPYVILENILLETNIITFSENIYTDHKHPLTADFYHEMQGAITFDLCKEAIDSFVCYKKPLHSKGEGREYIELYFRQPSSIYLLFDNIIQ
jgi:glycosyltransferase involved in cell wall biosynthesis